MGKKRISISTAIMLVMLSAVATYVIMYYVAAEYYDAQFGANAGLQAKYSKLEEITAIVDRHFVGEYDVDAAMEAAVAGYINGLGDRWSGYYTAEQTALLKESSENTYVGIGVTISTGGENFNGITRVSKDGPADKAGVMPMDIITHVDGVPVSTFESQDAMIQAVKGLEGTKVRITVDRGGESLSFDITRATVYNEQVETSLLDNGIGYVYIAGFEKNVDTEFFSKVSALINEGARGLIFDVRMNPGGYLTVMVDMLDMLLPEGMIISMKDKNEEPVAFNSQAGAIEMPMVVITNEYTVSAAEFFAVALQEYGLAQVVGDQTGGKGYAQQLIELADGSSVNISTSRYYTPKGNSLIGTGVVPDHQVSLTEEELYNFYYLTDEEDTQLQKAIEVITPLLPEVIEVPDFDEDATTEGEGTVPADTTGAQHDIYEFWGIYQLSA